MPLSPTTRDIVIIGGSAGALAPLKCIASLLPRDLPAAVFVVLHVSADFRSYIPQILNSAGPLEARHAEDGELVQRGTIYVAKPDFHLLLEDGHIRESRGPRENRHRPAIDPLFRTAARLYGRRVIGVILSGNLDDGAAGLMTVKMRGGLAIVQEPNEALSPEMPTNAIRYAQPEYILPVGEIAKMIAKSVRSEPSEGEAGPMEDKEGRKSSASEPDVADLRAAVEEEKSGEPSEFACPECHGVLWEERNGELVRYRCRVGHAYTESALSGEMSQATEAALWASLRALAEQSALLKRMANRSGEKLGARYRDQAAGIDEHCDTIKKILLDDERSEAAASG